VSLTTNGCVLIGIVTGRVVVAFVFVFVFAFAFVCVEVLSIAMRSATPPDPTRNRPNGLRSTGALIVSGIMVRDEESDLGGEIKLSSSLSSFCFVVHLSVHQI
jgi:hypothetical protein